MREPLHIEVFALIAFGAWVFLKLVLPRLMRSRRIAHEPEVSVVVRPDVPRAIEERSRPRPAVRAPKAEPAPAPRPVASSLRAAIVMNEILGPPRGATRLERT